MTEYAPPPSPDLTDEEIDALMMSPLSDDEVEELSAPEPERISTGELLLLNIETRIGRIADALEAANKIKAAGADNMEALTQQVHRLADALDSISAVFGCITERVEGQDGVYRGYVRHDRTTNGILSYAGNEAPED